MKSNLHNLIELQKIDSKLQALEDLKGDLPQRVVALKSELQEIKDDLEKQLSELQETKRLRLHWEGEVDLLKENLEKFQNQLYSVTTNRQYDAITMQIENVNEKISEGDKNKKEFEKKEQELTEKTQQLQDKIEILEQNLQVKERELHEKIKSTEDEFQLYQQKRLELASQIKKPVLYQYERIRKVKGATTVVEINKYACGGCFSAIPPQKAVEVRHMNQLILCESCGRIMVYTNDKPMVAS